MRRATCCLALVGCVVGTPERHENTTPMQTPCSVEGVTGAVSGVVLAIRSDSCVYAYGSPGVFVFEVVVDASAPALHFPAEEPGCTRRLYPYTSDPLSLTSTLIYNAERAFCSDCSRECSPAEPELTIQPVVGTASGVIEWSGREGATPSSEGPFFEPGAYAVRVWFHGGDIGDLVAELPITIVER